jgi:N-acyl-D-aspartate/D-glutamate deacylase
MMTGPRVLHGLSDGAAHCGTVCDASLPAMTIGLWSKGSKARSRIRLEDLVHSNTKRNADHVGRHHRGVPRPDYLADLNVIDTDKLDLSLPAIVQDLPAGGTRLVQRPEGYRWTVKNGQVTFDDSEWTGQTPGGLLRGARPFQLA